jgi:hypothetical protein
MRVCTQAPRKGMHRFGSKKKKQSSVGKGRVLPWSNRTWCGHTVVK